MTNSYQVPPLCCLRENKKGSWRSSK